MVPTSPNIHASISMAILLFIIYLLISLCYVQLLLLILSLLPYLTNIDLLGML